MTKCYENNKSEYMNNLKNATKEVVLTPNMFRNYLTVLANNSKLSSDDAIIISKYLPEATELRTYDEWNSFFCPPYNFESGVVISDNEKYVRVFDVRQTPSVNHKTYTYVPSKVIDKLKNICPCPIEYLHDCETDYGYYDREEDVIYLPLEMCTTSKVYAYALNILRALSFKRGFKDDFISICGTYIICVRNNIDIRRFDFSFVPEKYKNQSDEEIRKTLNETLNEIRPVLDMLEKGGSI